jgi:hypothetical protein
VYPTKDHVLSREQPCSLRWPRAAATRSRRALPAAPHAIAATPVWLAAVFAVAGLTVIPRTRTVARARRTTSAG